MIAVLLSSLFAFSALTMAPIAASTTSRAVIMPGLKLKSFLYPACCCATFTAYRACRNRVRLGTCIQLRIRMQFENEDILLH